MKPANEMHGRELHEAVARTIFGEDWNWHGEPASVESMLAWLHEREEWGEDGAFLTTYSTKAGFAAFLDVGPGWSTRVGRSEGRDLREALERLVLAVVRREQGK